MFIAFLAALSLAAQSPQASTEVQAKGTATATIDQGRDSFADQTDEAARLIHNGKPADAISMLDRVIAAEEATHKAESRLIFSAQSMTEALIYSAMAAEQKKSAIVLNETWAFAYFLKGFALIDSNRPDEAKVWFDKAVSLAPMNSQFLSERAEWYKTRKDWSNALADFESAFTAAEFAPDDLKNAQKARALRGRGFVKIELGDLKEAEKLFRESLRFDPRNAGALSELQYIKSLKRN